MNLPPNFDNYFSFQALPMKVLKISLFGMLIYFSSCDKRRPSDWTHKSKIEMLTFADSVWVNFMTEMENGNVEFLIKHSLDTIQCVDCKIDPIKKTEFYKADFIFKSHLEKLKHLKSLRSKEFRTYIEDDQIKVSYSFPSTFFQGEGYNLIFTFVKVGDKYLFTGMFVT